MILANRNMDRPSEVYIATNLVNGKIYVGVTTAGRLGRRIWEHGRDAKANISNSKFHNALRKHGIKNFFFEVVERHPNMTAGFVAEMRLIAELSPAYNTRKGGEGGNYGDLTAEGRERQKAACRGNKWRLGKTHTPEVREKLRQAAISNPVALTKFGHLGPKAASKMVVCLNDGSVYESASSAARTHGLAKSTVTHLCKRDKKRVTAGKCDLVFRYFGDHHGGTEEVSRAITARRILAREVVCVSDGTVLSSLLSASKTYGIPHTSLGRHCEDGRPLKNGLIFKYVEAVK
jgi:group I intron endonuclease